MSVVHPSTPNKLLPCVDSSSPMSASGTPKRTRKTPCLAKMNGTAANESSTTINVGKDTYTIVASRKSSGGKMVSTETEKTTNENGETIRIFRRSRSARSSRGDGPDGAIGVIDDHPDEEESGGDVFSTDDLPAPDTPTATLEAATKLRQLISRLRESTNGIDSDTLVSNLEYISEVVNNIASKQEDDTEDDLSELQSEAVPDEVRKWLASTFAKQEAVTRRSEERPSFRSVANAIRTGIFIERIYRRMSSSQLMVVPQEVQKHLRNVDEWNFDTFSFTRASKGSPLRYIGYELLTKHGCLHKYKIPPSLLETMLGHVEAGYTQNANPYHNNMHACDVVQTVHYFISQSGIGNWLSDLEIFTSLMAAIIHDYDHSGTTNNFHINSGSDLALLYNDRAVLENHHVSAFFRTIQEHNCNIFLNMQKQDFRDFRSLIIEMVLHTDMTQHFSQLKAMKSLLQQHNGEPSFDKTKVLCLMLHSCDVSHPAKRWDLHHQWTSRCMEEFFVQGDREQELGLEFSPLCDRHNTMVPQSQIGFIDFIVSPTLTILGDVLESILLSADFPGERVPELKPDGSVHAGLYRPWPDILTTNKGLWQKKHDAGEQTIALPSDLDSDPEQRPCRTPSSGRSSHHSMPFREADEEADPTEAAVLATARGQLEQKMHSNQTTEEPPPSDPLKPSASKITLDSEAPEKDTSLSDIVGDLPPSVLSRPGTPGVWAFDDKETSLRAIPPRPASASMCSPPAPRKVPISVDHHLRK